MRSFFPRLIHITVCIGVQVGLIGRQVGLFIGGQVGLIGGQVGLIGSRNISLILPFRTMGKHPLFSGTDRGRKSHLRDEGQTRSFTATMAVRVRQPWGSFGFIGGQIHSGDARDRRLFE